MTEVKYYYSAGKKWFIDFAASLSNATGEKVEVMDNSLILPSSLATGSFEFYELTDSFSVLLTDCIFFKELKLHRKAVAGNEHYKVFFNISDAPIIVYKQSGRTVNISASLAEAVLFSSHTSEIIFYPGVNKRMRTVQIIFHRSWGVSHLLENSNITNVQVIRELVSYEPVQFTTSLDLKSYDLIEQMLSKTLPDFTRKLYLEGCAIQLISMLVNNLVEQEQSKSNDVSDDARQIIQLKKDIEAHFENPIPSITEAAQLCLMSRTRFTIIFKSIYGKSYAMHFQEQRMNKAVELLSHGKSITEVGHRVGYANIGYFAKVFKDHFGITPGKYQQNMVQALLKEQPPDSLQEDT